MGAKRSTFTTNILTFTTSTWTLDDWLASLVNRPNSLKDKMWIISQLYISIFLSITHYNCWGLVEKRRKENIMHVYHTDMNVSPLTLYWSRFPWCSIEHYASFEDSYVGSAYTQLPTTWIPGWTIPKRIDIVEAPKLIIVTTCSCSSGCDLWRIPSWR